MWKPGGGSQDMQRERERDVYVHKDRYKAINEICYVYVYRERDGQRERERERGREIDIILYLLYSH